MRGIILLVVFHCAKYFKLHLLIYLLQRYFQKVGLTLFLFFLDKENKAEKLKDIPKVTRLSRELASNPGNTGGD